MAAFLAGVIATITGRAHNAPVRRRLSRFQR